MNALLPGTGGYLAPGRIARPRLEVPKRRHELGRGAGSGGIRLANRPFLASLVVLWTADLGAMPSGAAPALLERCFLFYEIAQRLANRRMLADAPAPQPPDQPGDGRDRDGGLSVGV